MQEVIDNSMEEIEQIELEIKSPQPLKTCPNELTDQRLFSEDAETFDDS